MNEGVIAKGRVEKVADDSADSNEGAADSSRRTKNYSKQQHESSFNASAAPGGL